MIDEGTIVPDAMPTIERESNVTATIDGQSAFGQVVGREAVDLACTKAAKTGVGVVGMRDATHLGRVGEWAERATDEGLTFVGFVNTQGAAPLVAPPNSAERRLPPNPITFGIPTFDQYDCPIVLDMSTSQVSGGKILDHQQTGEPLPDAWTITESGDPVTDANAFWEGEGALLPLGGRPTGHKGFGLTIVTELFAGIFGAGRVFGPGEPETHSSNAAVFVVMDPECFLDREEVAARIDSLITYLKETQPSPQLLPEDRTKSEFPLLPGERGYRTVQRREAEGIPISNEYVALLEDLASEQGIEDVLPSELD